MRTGKELIEASFPYAQEVKSKSWYYLISIIALLIMAIGATFIPIHWLFRLPLSILSGLLMVRFFIIYHDYNHFAILKNSKPAKLIMTVFGIFILAPITIWKRTHNHHHINNSKLSANGIGSFPLLEKNEFYKLDKKSKFRYLASRHYLTIALGYISLFIFDFNIKTFILSPRQHWDSIIALLFHFTMAVLIYKYGGIAYLMISWIIPFAIANAVGSYLFYAQHNFPGAIYVEKEEWDYTNAALKSTSYLKMNSLLNWFTGDIGFHHVHHLNHRIPFYRLREAMDAIPELQDPITTTFNPKDIIACLKLKVWDSEANKLTSL